MFWKRFCPVVALSLVISPAYASDFTWIDQVPIGVYKNLDHDDQPPLTVNPNSYKQGESSCEFVLRKVNKRTHDIKVVAECGIFDSKSYTVQATWSVAVRGEETWVTITTPNKEKTTWCEGCAVQEDLFLSKNDNLPKGYLYMDGDSELILSKKDGKYKIEMSSKTLVDVSCEPINSTVKIQKEWPYLVRFDAKCHGTTEPHKFEDTVTHIAWQVVDASALVMTWKYDDFPPTYGSVWKWQVGEQQVQTEGQLELSRRWYEQDVTCRGGSGDEHACDLRTTISKKLKAQGCKYYELGGWECEE